MIMTDEKIGKFMQRQERIMLYIIIGLIIMISVIIFIQKKHPDDDETVYNVSVIVREANDNFSKGVNQAAVDFNADVHIVTDYGSALRQDEYISREVDNGAAALVILAQTADVTASSDGGKRIGVPVVSIGGTLSGAVCTIAPDNTKIGSTLARLTVDSGASTCCIVCSGRTEGYMQERITAIKEGLERAGIEYDMCFCDRESEAARAIAGKNAQVLLVPDESMMTMVCRSAGEEEIIYGVGYDNSLRTWLENGRIDALVVYSDYDIGYMSVHAAVEEIMNGGAQDVEIGTYVANGGNMYYDPMDKILFPIE